MKRIVVGFIFLFSMLIGLIAFAAIVRLDATVDRNQLSQDENVTLMLTLTSDSSVGEDEEPRLPTIDGFELLNKWTQSQSSSVFENGKFTFQRKLIFYYTLSPQKTGKILIGPASMRVGGEEVQSKPITLTVSAAGSGAPPGQRNAQRGRPQGGRGSAVPPGFPGGAGNDEDDTMNPNGGLPPFGQEEDDDMFNQLLRQRGLLPSPGGGIKTAPDTGSHEAFFVTVDANKKKAYVGEEIVTTWYLYSRGTITSFDALKYPELKGFWKEELEQPNRLNFQQEIVNGVPYNRALLVSYALFPIAAGKKNIDSFKAKATVIEMNSGMSMFGIGQPFTSVKVSKELPIEVLPLPTAGRPPSFSGAVGHFNITGSLSATQAKVNQPVSLKIRFSGEGNVKAIELPPLDLPKTLEVYDTKKDSQFAKNGEGYKEFEILIIPRAEGAMTIPPISVSYFDPKSGKYVSSQTPTFNLKVLPGDGSAGTNFSAPLAKSETADKSSGRDIHYLKTAPSMVLPPKVQAIAWFLVYLLTFGWFGWQVRKLTGSRAQDNTALLKKRVKAKLRAAQNKLKAGDWRGVGIESSNAVLSTLGEVSGAGGGSLTTENMLSRLPASSKLLQGRITKFLGHCELMSFAPKEMAEQLRQTGKGEQEMKAMITEAENIISDLFVLAKREKSS